MATQTGLWKKRVLVPFWIVRICIMIFLIASYGYALRTIDGFHMLTKPGIAKAIVFILFLAICLLIDILAIVLFIRDALKPGTFLTMNCFQTGFFGGVCIMQIVGVTQGRNEASLGFAIFILFTFVGLLMYSVYGYRRAKQQGQRGHYVAAHNPAVYHPAVPTEYAPPYQNAPPYQQNTAYYPQTATLLGGQHDQQLPPYQADGGMTTQHMQQQPKPAHMA